MVQLISVHIPKTAGTAFRQVLLEVYGCDRVLGDYPPNNIYYPQQPLSPEIQVIHGHFEPGKYQGYFPQAKRIVWLRHPIFRLISEYYFAKTIKDKQNVIHAKLLKENLSLAEFAAIPQMRNLLSQKIAGMELGEFDFVGIQEFYAEDLADLKRIMGWQNFQTSVKNSNRYPDYYRCLQDTLGESELIKKLAVLNREDLQLYQQALQLRAKRRNEPLFLQSTLADWQRSQFILSQMQNELHQVRQELTQTKYWLQQGSDRPQVLELTVTPQQQISDRLLGFHIDSPTSPIYLTLNPIEFSGWVIGKNASVVKVILAHNGTTLTETTVALPRPDVAKVYHTPDAKQSGFEMTSILTGISQAGKVELQALLTDNSKVTLGIIRTASVSGSLFDNLQF